MADTAVLSPLLACGQRCALLLALPQTLEEFATDIAAGDAMDYARTVAGQVDATLAWSASGVRVAAACGQLARTAEECGVTVVRSAQLGDINAAFAAHDAVTVVAHWRGARFRASDFRAGLGTIRTLLRGLDHPAARNLNLVLADVETYEAAADELNSFIFGHKGLLPSTSDHLDGIWLYAPFEVAAGHRMLLDDLLAPLVVPGNRLELRDGLHEAAALADAIPCDWSGIADLSICQSAVLEHAVKQGRDDRRVIIHSGPVAPEVRFPIIAATYKLLAARRGSGGYVTAITDLYQSLRRS